MSVKYSDETIISNRLYDHLCSHQYSILQLISPGSQATLSLCYKSSNLNRKKTIFPDLIALNQESIIVGEIKPKFSNADKIKLLDIQKSVDGEKCIRSLVYRVSKINVESFTIKFLLVHGDESAIPDPDIVQLILTENQAITLDLQP